MLHLVGFISLLYKIVSDCILYIYVFYIIYFILTQPVYTIYVYLHQGGTCRKKKFRWYLRTYQLDHRKQNFHQRWFGWPFTKTNTMQTSSTLPINKNSPESLNRVVTLCNSKTHIYIATVNSIINNIDNQLDATITAY